MISVVPTRTCRGPPQQALRNTFATGEVIQVARGRDGFHDAKWAGLVTLNENDFHLRNQGRTTRLRQMLMLRRVQLGR